MRDIATGVVADRAEERQEYEYSRNVLYPHRADKQKEESIVWQQSGSGHDNRIHAGRCTHHPDPESLRLSDEVGNRVIGKEVKNSTGKSAEKVNRYQLVTAEVLYEKFPEPVHDQHVEKDMENP